MTTARVPNSGRELALSLLCLGCGAWEDDPGAAFADLMREVEGSSGFQGVAVVGRGGSVLFEGGWGFANDSAQLPVTPDVPVDGVPLRRPWSRPAYGASWRSGWVALDDPVQPHLPAFPHTGTVVRDLLEHSAGIVELNDLQGLANEDIVGAIDTQPAFPAGTRFRYCNECFDILALVTERAALATRRVPSEASEPVAKSFAPGSGNEGQAYVLSLGAWSRGVDSEAQ